MELPMRDCHTKLNSTIIQECTSSSLLPRRIHCFETVPSSSHGVPRVCPG
ncbi:hypothetical protein VFPPC_18284 [Pochonia chlamydosporia 170]|uniref:Uncharacterized protein n=1 Tax=Pochonia chlamydosporia 170 TaxID=1380566 RepID=A0A219AQU2_METCM|nr:hypothetical protein VFPPC_18284 [Pochonia chlamydosporia 170]OWT42545.1 hypothetical protein VFPPC_18284 [Pochonia chlamydosporia 170]